MKQELILWPFLLQVLLPILVLLVMAKRKSADKKSGAFDPIRSALDNKAWSEGVVKTSNNLANQFQVPVLFYALCLMAFSIEAVGPVFLSLAWAFVVTRYMHAYVHITTNVVPRRLMLFSVGVLILIAMIVILAWSLAGL